MLTSDDHMTGSDRELALARERSVTALHEAAHVVAYLDFGRSFRYVTLKPRCGAYGMVRLHRPRLCDIRESSVVGLIGPLTERYAEYLAQDADIIFARSAASADVVRAVTSASLDAWEDEDEVEDEGSDFAAARHLPPWHPVERSVSDAFAIIDGHWFAMQQLARALDASPRALTYRECRAVVETFRPSLPRTK